jgi:hypothetical protein
MHAHIYTMHEKRLKWNSHVLNWIKKKERKCSVCKRWSCNSRHEHLKIQSDYGRTFHDKGIFKKLTREGKNLAFYTTINKVITLKHLIIYSNLKTYINPKGMIGMPVTNRHVWSHAYEHDINLFPITNMFVQYTLTWIQFKYICHCGSLGFKNPKPPSYKHTYFF